MHFSPCFMLRSTSVHVHMLGSMSYHVYVLSFHMFTCMFPCLYDQIQVSTCSRAWIYALLALCHLPCACVLRTMFVCLDLGYVCHAMCYCSPFVTLSFFYLVFWPIGSYPIQTLWSLSLSIHFGPYQKVWITLFSCLCLLCLFVPPVGFFAFLHACFYVHALVLLVSVSSTLQHNEIMDIRSKPTFVPRGHHLLFAFLLTSLLVCWLAFLLLSHATLAISILLVCFAPFSHYLRISSFPLLVCCFLVFVFACTHLE